MTIVKQVQSGVRVLDLDVCQYKPPLKNATQALFCHGAVLNPFNPTPATTFKALAGLVANSDDVFVIRMSNVGVNLPPAGMTAEAGAALTAARMKEVRNHLLRQLQSSGLMRHVFTGAVCWRRRYRAQVGLAAGRPDIAPQQAHRGCCHGRRMCVRSNHACSP